MQARVLVIRAERRLLRVLPVALSRSGCQPGTAPTRQDALAAAASRPPDAVILDMELPDLPGADVVRGLRRWSRAPVVALRLNRGAADIVDVLEACADDCVSKAAALAELLALLRAVMRRVGAGCAVPAVWAGRHVVDVARRCVPGRAGEVTLTRVDWEVLETLARHAGKLVSQEPLLTDVGGAACLRESSSLRAHVAGQQRKLEVDPARPRYLLTEPGCGCRLSTCQAA